MSPWCVHRTSDFTRAQTPDDTVKYLPTGRDVKRLGRIRRLLAYDEGVCCTIDCMSSLTPECHGWPALGLAGHNRRQSLSAGRQAPLRAVRGEPLPTVAAAAHERNTVHRLEYGLCTEYCNKLMPEENGRRHAQR
jgi:hypothetical protein